MRIIIPQVIRLSPAVVARDAAVAMDQAPHLIMVHPMMTTKMTILTAAVAAVLDAVAKVDMVRAALVHKVAMAVKGAMAVRVGKVAMVIKADMDKAINLAADRPVTVVHPEAVDQAMVAVVHPVMVRVRAMDVNPAPIVVRHPIMVLTGAPITAATMETEADRHTTVVAVGPIMVAVLAAPRATADRPVPATAVALPAMGVHLQVDVAAEATVMAQVAGHQAVVAQTRVVKAMAATVMTITNQAAATVVADAADVEIVTKNQLLGRSEDRKVLAFFVPMCSANSF